MAPAASLAKPPSVTTTTPAAGAADVDPGLGAISVTFDQDMDTSGFSWVVAGAAKFPPTAGKPSWDGRRTCTLPVKLGPGTRYGFSINGPRHHGFKNTSGEPAVPLEIIFTTAGPADRAPGTPGLGADANRPAIVRLREAIDGRYSHRDLRGVDWDAAFAGAERSLLGSESVAAFADAVAKLLSPARDMHLWVVAGGETFPTHRREYEANFPRGGGGRGLPGFRDVGGGVFTARLDGGLRYLRIDGWSAAAGAALDGVLDPLLESAAGLVIDVRANGGGDELVARRVAGRFIRERAVYAKHVYRDPAQASGFSDVHERVLEPFGGNPYPGRVAVLVGPACVSSCEAFLLMMRQAPRCQLVGARSGGSSGNPQPFDLGNGVTVFVPSWRAMDAGGKPIEGTGIAPDLEVETELRDFGRDGADPVLDAAIGWERAGR